MDDVLFAHSPGNCYDYWGIPTWLRRQHQEDWKAAHLLTPSLPDSYLGWVSLSDAEALSKYPPRQHNPLTYLDTTIVRHEYLAGLLESLAYWQEQSSIPAELPGLLRVRSILTRCHDMGYDLLADAP